MDLTLIGKEKFVETLLSQEKPWHDNYLAMYSSSWKGYVTDPALMLVPADDHLVHRGDGVFDVIRCANGRLYRMEEHLSRLERSAEAVSIALPEEFGRLGELIRTLVVKGGQRDCLVRVIVSRGPGSFTVNPFDCPSSHLYINVIRYHRPPARYYESGVSLITSKIPIKKAFFATVKSCNYLPNVLMRMEAVLAACDYAVALDEHGCLAEGATENIGVVSTDGYLKFPGFERTLAGITVQRVAELTASLVEDGTIRGIKFTGIPLAEAYQAREILIMGTSINVVPVTKYDGKRVGTGLPGTVFSKLSIFMEKDIRENENVLTALDWEGDGLSP
jgi:branched-subunit amino acid aminotransferase/4-amino-4-deoxychorismate lyase